MYSLCCASVHLTGLLNIGLKYDGLEIYYSKICYVNFIRLFLFTYLHLTLVVTDDGLFVAFRNFKRYKINYMYNIHKNNGIFYL